jgi:hypothetical protein
MVAAISVSDEPEDSPPAPVLETKRAEDLVAVETPARQEPVAANGRAARRRRARERRREKLATSQPVIVESREHQPREVAAETPVETSVETPIETCVARPDPIDDIALLAEVAALRDTSIRRASPVMNAPSGSRGLLVAGVVAVALASFATGLGGGFVIGQRSRPVAEPQSTVAAAVTDPPPVASLTQTDASIPVEKVSNPEPIAAPVPRQTVTPAVDAGRLLVRSTPAGAGVVVDGQSRGVTPLAVRDLAFGAHTIEVTHPGHDTRQRRVSLSERRPSRSLDFELRPTNDSAPAAAETNATGSLQVASRPAGAQVFVDDTLVGTTPFVLPNVSAGSKQLRIELAGYQVWTKSVQIKASARARVSASLEP